MVRGPFAGPKDLVAGVWMFRVKSLDEAIDAEDFGAQYTPELRQAEARMRAEIDKRR